jgi:Transposase C of IS166 homeodomain
MTSAPESLPSDLVAAHAMILAERTARLEAEAKLANARAQAALITYYKLEIEKLRRQLYGTRSERKARLLEQMELELEELETTATEDELAAEKAAARTLTVQSFQRKRPGRANRSPIICRASASSSPRRRAARAAVRTSCRSWAKTSPRRWRSCLASGR